MKQTDSKQASRTANSTEQIDPAFKDLDLRSTSDVLQVLLASQQRAVGALTGITDQIDLAVTIAASRLALSEGRLVMVGAGASGRLAVQDGAELWPTYGWPHSRLLLCMAGGEAALLRSIENSEDDEQAARSQVLHNTISSNDVVLALAASGRSTWTCAWLDEARKQGALTIGFSNNAQTPLLELAEVGVWLDSGAEVLAGSTRMAAGTAQKVALNLFSTALMVRLNRTYGNLMVDMAAVNSKLDGRRLRMLQSVLPELDDEQGRKALQEAEGWVKLAALIARGLEKAKALELLEKHAGSLRAALQSIT